MSHPGGAHRARIGLDARKWNDGGIGTYIRALAKRLPGALPEGGSWVAFVRPSDLREVSAQLPGWDVAAVDAPGYSLREPGAVGRAAREHRLDLLHSPHYVIPGSAGCPVVVTIHDAIQTDPRFFAFHKRLYARTMIRRALRQSQAAITVSHAARVELLERIGSLAAKLSVVHNGVEPPHPAGTEESLPQIEARIGSPLPGASIILAVANHRPHKGMAILVDALSRIAKPVGAGVVFVGVEGDGSAWRKISTALPEAWRGATLELPRVDPALLGSLYRVARVFVSPSFAEGFGLPLLEAMSAGSTVIASDIPPHREVGGEVPFYFPPGDPRSLANLIDEELHRRLPDGPHRAAGIAHARGFSWENSAKETAAIYRRVLEAGE